MHRTLLPESFPVHVSDQGVVNRPFPGTEERMLKTVNAFRGYPGCYIACYSHSERDSAYSVGGGIYVMGQVRVRGRYEGRVCNPENYVGRDISAANEFTDLCAAALPDRCRNGCWAGGDTGGWFGIQSW
ncbi:MAG: hypothetical protein JXA20_12255 [Spirochaetes bacterium]|nr:hypothetical protein [Spirochaetota bacterium]